MVVSITVDSLPSQISLLEVVNQIEGLLVTSGYLT